MKEMYKANYDPSKCSDRPYQSMYLWENSKNPDGYERGSWYETEAEAIEGAKRGRENHQLIEFIINKRK